MFDTPDQRLRSVPLQETQILTLTKKAPVSSLIVFNVFSSRTNFMLLTPPIYTLMGYKYIIEYFLKICNEAESNPLIVCIIVPGTG
jgi:hypothetical protein